MASIREKRNNLELFNEVINELKERNLISSKTIQLNNKTEAKIKKELKKLEYLIEIQSLTLDENYIKNLNEIIDKIVANGVFDADVIEKVMHSYLSCITYFINERNPFDLDLINISSILKNIKGGNDIKEVFQLYKYLYKNDVKKSVEFAGTIYEKAFSKAIHKTAIDLLDIKYFSIFLINMCTSKYGTISINHWSSLIGILKGLIKAINFENAKSNNDLSISLSEMIANVIKFNLIVPSEIRDGNFIKELLSKIEEYSLDTTYLINDKYYSFDSFKPCKESILNILNSGIICLSNNILNNDDGLISWNYVFSKLQSTSKGNINIPGDDLSIDVPERMYFFETLDGEKRPESVFSEEINIENLSRRILNQLYMKPNVNIRLIFKEEISLVKINTNGNIFSSNTFNGYLFYLIDDKYYIFYDSNSSKAYYMKSLQMNERIELTKREIKPLILFLVYTLAVNENE